MNHEHTDIVNQPILKTAATTTAPQLVEQCLQALEATGALQGWRWRQGSPGQGRVVDGHLELRIAGIRIRFAVIVRPSVHEAHLGPLTHLRQLVDAGTGSLLLCTRRIAQQSGARLRELGIGYLDTTGTASLHAPGVVVEVTGRAPTKRQPLRARLTGTDLRLLHVLLREGGTAGRNQRQLAEAAGIALGAVGKGLRAFESRGLLRRRGATFLEIQEPAVAQAQFAEGWATVLRDKLEPRGYRALASQWIEQLPGRLATLGDRCLLGGELAAALLTGTLRTQHATLHIAPGSHRALAAELGLIDDADGPITLLERFGSGDGVQAPGHRLLQVHPLLVHAELVAIGDERLTPTVDALWRKWMSEGGSGGQ